MTEKRYVIPYNLDTQKRHHHTTEHGQVVTFMVQLEVRIKEEWKPVVRYDCAHGFTHRDGYNLRGKQRKGSLEMSFEEALTFADEDLDDHWEEYRERFLKGELP